MVESPARFNEEHLKMWIDSEISKATENPVYDLTIVSHEELSGHPHGHSIVDPYVVADNFKQAFPNAKIIMIIRNQFDYLLSIYAFRVAVKGQESRSLEKFLTEEGRLGLFDKLEYDKIIGRYAELFGKENVLVLPFELLRKDSETFVRKIIDFLKVPFISLEGDSPVNESTKLAVVVRFWRPINFVFDAVLGFLRLIRIQKEEKYPFLGIRYKFYSFKRTVTRFMNALFRTTSLIDIAGYSDYDELVEKYSESNTRLQKLIDLDLKEFGYPVQSRT
jgi:hypothetical protein